MDVLQWTHGGRYLNKEEACQPLNAIGPQVPHT